MLPGVGNEAIIATLRRLLQPLVRIMVRHGVSTETVEQLLRKVFVEVAEREFALPNRKQSDSRISVLTGLSRKKVARYRKLDLNEVTDELAKFNRAERVITAWLREPDFCDEKRDPRVLPFEGRNSFSDLIERYAGDVPVRAVADELRRLGNIREDEFGRLHLLVRGYRPGPATDQAVIVFGAHARDFLETIDNNLSAKRDEDLLFQRQVTYDAIPARDVDEFRELSARLGQRVLEDLDRWLAEKKSNAVASDDEIVRLGFGAYQVVAHKEGSNK